MRPRTPKAKAELTGTATRNPGRFKGRNEPTGAPLGEPSSFLKPRAKDAWNRFVAELPWLVESDRALLEVASEIRGRIAEPGGGVGVNVLQTYSAVLSKLAATPVDRSRVPMPADDQDDDPHGFFDPS